MTTESDPVVTQVTVVLDRADDWHKWLFIRKDTAQKNDLWQYVDPATPAADLPTLMAQPEPQLADYHGGATSIAQLTAAELKLYQWDYERWERQDINKTIAAKHLYLIENKDTPHNRLTTLKKHLAPSDASRQRDLIARYKNLQTPPRGKKVEEWLRSWVEVTNMCIAAQVPASMGSRAQEDFLVACRMIDPEYGTSGLRALIDLEEAGSAIPSVKDYVSKFTTYLKRVRPIQISLDVHHPRRPKDYTNAIGQKKLDAALAADLDLKHKIDKALDKWRSKQQDTGSIAMDDGNPPFRPTVNMVRYMCHDEIREPRALHDDKKLRARQDDELRARQDGEPRALHDDEEPCALHDDKELRAQQDKEFRTRHDEEPRAQHKDEEPRAQHKDEEPLGLHEDAEYCSAQTMSDGDRYI
ncbi:hypothetical protein EJ04DRAFT_503734 [Polyplosphaeria fusca]|uniref:Uncharacterized protein n=1 Tax=Polyplosphaeria fusca TaxID=682080 RepID=A0A9P4UXB6_9PLEO|nr:hypothetical protein EJ04DRAFT_503734 [Polyplosphaeria fusca]